MYPKIVNYCYVFGIIVLGIVLLSTQIGLPILAGLLELYPQLLLIASVLHTLAILLPVGSYLLTHHFIKYDQTLEEYDDLAFGFIFLIFASAEFVCRIVSIIIAWLYYTQPVHNLYIANIVLSLLSNIIGTLTIIYQYYNFLPGIKFRLERYCRYDQL